QYRDQVMEDRTVTAGSGPSPMRRFVLLVREDAATPGDSILVATFLEPHVNIIRRYRIPGRAATLLVISFLGDPFETVYETQQCALAGLPGSGVQRLDCWYGALPCPSLR